VINKKIIFYLYNKDIFRNKEEVLKITEEKKIINLNFQMENILKV